MYSASALSVAGVIVIAAWEPRAVAAAGLFLATLGFLLAIPFVSYVARRRNRKTHWIYVLAFVLLLPAVVCVLGITFDQPLLIRVPVATICLLVSAAAAVSLLYLLWLRAIPLAFHSGDRDGDITLPEAQSFAAVKYQEPILEQDQRGPPPSPEGKAFRVARMVTPPGAERSLIHRFVSEIFEPHEPPFHTSFLRVDCLADAVTVTTFGVTGETDAAEEIDTVTLPYPDR